MESCASLLFSVVIPSYARPHSLSECLNALAQLDFPSDQFEVIVVDDGSPEPLDPVINRYRQQMNVTSLNQSNVGPAAARNNGAQQARGRYLVFTDDDCMPASNWLVKLADAFEKAPDCLIGGKTINALPEVICSEASQLLIDYLYSYYSQSDRMSFFTSNNMAMPRQRFLDVNGFDTRFYLAAGEDREFCYRWKRNGWTMRYASLAKVLHAHHLTFQTFCRQHFSYGRGAAKFRGLLAQEDSNGVRVEPLSFYANLVKYPFRVTSLGKALALCSLLIVSQFANAGGFFFQLLTGKNRDVIVRHDCT